jgi:hypothetical protein
LKRGGLHAFLVRDVAAGKQGQRAEAEALTQEQAPLERSDERLVLGEHGLIDASRGPKEGV